MSVVDATLPHDDHIKILGVSQSDGRSGWYRTFDGHILGDSRGYPTREQAAAKQRELVDGNRAATIRGDSIIMYRLADDI